MSKEEYFKRVYLFLGRYTYYVEHDKEFNENDVKRLKQMVADLMQETLNYIRESEEK